MENSTPQKDLPANEPKKDKKEESWWDIIKFALLTLVIIIPIRLYIAQPFIVSGDSMYPTFANGEYLIVDELSYNFRVPARGDVVVFRYPVDPSKYFIKRIIGLPGETVTVKDGKVFLTTTDGLQSALAEPYLGQITNKNVTTKIGADEYFVMGDNRLVSYDSRYWGPVKVGEIRGRAWLRLFPPTKISYLPGEYSNYQK